MMPRQINANFLEVALPSPSAAQREATSLIVFVDQLADLNKILHNNSVQLVVWHQPSPPKFTQVPLEMYPVSLLTLPSK
jgi:hypothetical protein